MTTGDFETAFLLWLITFGPLFVWALVRTIRDAKKYDEVEFGGRTYRILKGDANDLTR